MHFANKLAAVAAALTMLFATSMPASADHQRQNNDGAIVVGAALAIIGLAIASSDRGGRHYGQPVYGYHPPHPGAWQPTPPRNHYVLRQPPPQHFGHPAPRRGNALPPLRPVIDRDGNRGFVTPNGINCGAYGMHSMLSFKRGSTYMRPICYH